MKDESNLHKIYKCGKRKTDQKMEQRNIDWKHNKKSIVGENFAKCIASLNSLFS